MEYGVPRLVHVRVSAAQALPIDGLGCGAPRCVASYPIAGRAVRFASLGTLVVPGGRGGQSMWISRVQIPPRSLVWRFPPLSLPIRSLRFRPYAKVTVYSIRSSLSNLDSWDSQL